MYGSPSGLPAPYGLAHGRAVGLSGALCTVPPPRARLRRCPLCGVPKSRRRHLRFLEIAKTNVKLIFLSKFQSDVMIEVEKMEKISEEWQGLSPNEAAENTPESAVSTVK